MTQLLLQHANIVQLLVLFSFVAALFRIRKNTIHYGLIAVLSVSLLNEIISYIYLINNQRSTIFYNINVILHHSIWIFILAQVAKNKQLLLYLLAFYIAFSTLNFTMLEGYSTFNSNTFILGAIFYLISFILLSFNRLKLEELSFFTNKQYILLCAPLLLFIALSFMMGFKSKSLYDLKIYGDISLYKAITHFANLIYYILINVYIFDKKKPENGI